MQGKKVYFLSDAHLGAKLLKDNREREIMLVEFLQSIKPDCLELYLLGDMFDFWFEYKHVVPKGHVRFLAELANFTTKELRYISLRATTTSGLSTTWQKNVVLSCILP